MGEKYNFAYVELALSKDDYIRNKKLPNVSILMSSSDNEFSYVDTANNMGFFAKAIVDGLKGYADAGDVNHIISLRELVDYIKKCYHNELVTVNTAVTSKHHRY